MPCPYYHTLCDKCRSAVCRAYFPEKQPHIKEDLKPVCRGENYAQECLIYPEAVVWKQKRREKSLTEKCPFASNTVCSQPWLWICKGAVPPFFLTEIETNERGLSQRDEAGEVVFKEGRSIEDIRETCLSGNPKIYTECPWYKIGVEFREHAKQVKNRGK